MQSIAKKVLSAALFAMPCLAQSPVQMKLFVGLSRAEHCMRWNNPGCLQYTGQPGASKGPRGYAVFRNLRAGQAALRARIALGCGLTVRRFLELYNPGKIGYPARIAHLSNVSLLDTL